MLTMEDDRRCTAKSKRSGERCKRAAIRVSRQKAEILADRLGAQRDITPEKAILECITEAAGNVEMYRRLLVEIGLSVDADESGHPLIVLYNAERDRLFTLASTAARIGISELVVRISERQGEKLVKSLEQ
jgi:hypothetical protein